MVKADLVSGALGKCYNTTGKIRSKKKMKVSECTPIKR